MEMAEGTQRVLSRCMVSAESLEFYENAPGSRTSESTFLVDMILT